jgi:uncharacterized membrane protein/mono/diheme cytochrome c family protein
MRWILFMLAAVAWLLASAPARAATSLEKLGCVACHSVDGSPGRGPTLRGLAGSKRAVIQNGARAEALADPAYLARSILTPDAEIAEGYAAGSMPAFKLAAPEVDAVVAEITSLNAGGPPPAPGSMALLLLSTAAFVLLHVLLASMPVRRRLVASLGNGGFQGIYSLISLATLTGMILGFRSAPYVALWSAPGAFRWIPNVLMPIALIVFVCSVTTKSPTLAGKPGEPPTTEAIGIIRVTRHPMLWASLLWGLAHIPPNGELRALVLFGSLAALSIVGMVHIDARRSRLFPDAWAKIAATTSILPFAAIAAGRNRFVFREIGVVRVVSGLILWAALLHLHKLVFGLSPLP